MALDAQGTKLEIKYPDGINSLTEVGTITNFNIAPSRSERDKTTLAADERTYKVGLYDEGPWTFNVLWDNTDGGLDEVVDAFNAGADDLEFKITFSDDEDIELEAAYILNYSIDGDIDALTTGTITLRGVRK